MSRPWLRQISMSQMIDSLIDLMLCGVSETCWIRQPGSIRGQSIILFLLHVPAGAGKQQQQQRAARSKQQQQQQP
jgi:hypothetical protein